MESRNELNFKVGLYINVRLKKNHLLILTIFTPNAFPGGFVSNGINDRTFWMEILLLYCSRPNMKNKTIKLKCLSIYPFLPSTLKEIHFHTHWNIHTALHSHLCGGGVLCVNCLSHLLFNMKSRSQTTTQRVLNRSRSTVSSLTDSGSVMFRCSYTSFVRALFGCVYICTVLTLNLDYSLQGQDSVLTWRLVQGGLGQWLHLGHRAESLDWITSVEAHAQNIQTHIPPCPARHWRRLQRHHRWLSGHVLPQGPSPPDPQPRTWADGWGSQNLETDKQIQSWGRFNNNSGNCMFLSGRIDLKKECFSRVTLYLNDTQHFSKQGFAQICCSATFTSILLQLLIQTSCALY